MNNVLIYKGYLANIEFSPEDEVFFGKVHGINDLITFEATDVKKLKAAFHEAIDDYLKTCKKLNKEPNKTFRGIFNVRVDSEIHRRAAFIATQHNITLNEFVKKALDYAINHEKNLRLG